LATQPDKLSELQTVQNPSLGGYLIWQFGLGYQAEDSQKSNFLLAFLVLPLVLHRPTMASVLSTRKSSGLALFVSKLGEEHENLLAVHSRALALRQLSLQSIAFAINRGLITVDYEGAHIRSNTLTKKAPIPERIRSMSTAAQKIGFWFSKMSVHQIASTLRVQF
jgi:Family of unknown function (DUF6521)